MRASDYINELASRGRYHFTTDEATEAIGGSPAAVRGQLRRLKEAGKIASPSRSFHVIVPPEYQRVGCLPAEQFIDQLMSALGEPYYVALLSAAERYGAAHQRPQALQVMVRSNRKPVSCGQVRVEFIARADLEQQFTRSINTPRGILRYATPEVTALELVGYPRHAGGISNIATVLSELAGQLDASALLQAARCSPMSWSQRLGYLLESGGDDEPARRLADHVQQHARTYASLRRAAPVRGARRNPRWKLLVNTTVEVDT